VRKGKGKKKKKRENGSYEPVSGKLYPDPSFRCGVKSWSNRKKEERKRREGNVVKHIQ